jgi:hypothetical protein
LNHFKHTWVTLFKNISQKLLIKRKIQSKENGKCYKIGKLTTISDGREEDFWPLKPRTTNGPPRTIKEARTTTPREVILSFMRNPAGGRHLGSLRQGHSGILSFTSLISLAFWNLDIGWDRTDKTINVASPKIYPLASSIHQACHVHME